MFLYHRTFLALMMPMLPVAVGVGFIVPLLPVYAQPRGATGLWIGLIFGANPLTRAIFQFVFGRMANTRGLKVLLLIGLSRYAQVALGFFTAQSPWQLLLWRALQEVFGWMVEPSTRAYAGLLTPKGSEGRVMSVYNLAFFFGFAVGPWQADCCTRAWEQPLHLGIAILSLVSLVIIFVPECRSPVARLQQVVPLKIILHDPVIQPIIWAAASSRWTGYFHSLPGGMAGLMVLPAENIGLLVSLWQYYGRYRHLDEHWHEPGIVHRWLHGRPLRCQSRLSLRHVRLCQLSARRAPAETVTEEKSASAPLVGE